MNSHLLGNTISCPSPAKAVKLTKWVIRMFNYIPVVIKKYHCYIMVKKYLKTFVLSNSKNYKERSAFRYKILYTAKDIAHISQIHREIYIHEKNNLPYPIYQYAVTLTPKNPADNVLSQEYIQYVQIMCGQYASIKCLIYAEEVSDSGKRHIHGIVLTSDKCKFIKWRRHTRLHFTCNMITMLDGWINYILEDHPNELITWVP